MSGRKVFTAGEVLQAADVNDFLMDQSVMVFAGTAARGSAIPSPSEGMVTYRSDDDVVEVYNGSSFVPVGPGQILQVVSTTTSTSTSTTSASYVDTSCTATITPSSATSKIMVIADGTMNKGAGNIDAFVRLFRGTVSGTALGPDDGNQFFAGSSIQILVPISTSFLDSPNTTSATTYTLGIKNGGSGTVEIRKNQTMTLLEVAG